MVPDTTHVSEGTVHIYDDGIWLVVHGSILVGRYDNGEEEGRYPYRGKDEDASQ
jgi:hypothetical protein